MPDEVPTDRPTQLELIALSKLVRQMWGYLAVEDALHDKVNNILLRRGCNRVAALCLVSVLSGHANIDVLPR